MSTLLVFLLGGGGWGYSRAGRSARPSWRFAAALWLVFALAGSASAVSFTLEELTDGSVDSFESGNTLLTFSSFDVVITRSLSMDLDDYAVIVLDDGWRLVAPTGVADGNVGDIALSYDIMARIGHSIESAQIFFNGSALGVGSTASISEILFEDGIEIAALFVAATGGGLAQRSDITFFDEPVPMRLSAIKDIQVITFDPGTVASISVIDQRFGVVPEPSTFMLMAGGVLGLGAARRRRLLWR